MATKDNPGPALVDISGLKDHVKMAVLEASTDDATVESLKKLSIPLLIPYKDTLETASAEIDQLKTKASENENKIDYLTQQIEDLQTRCDDLEQQGRKASMRVFGVPENTPGTTDEKILSLINGNMKMQLPIVLEDIEVSHRVGPTRPPPSTGDQNALPQDGDPNTVTKHPRAILVKFAIRRVKSRVMEERKTLKDNHCKDTNGRDSRVYIQDDLTKRRANMYYQARQLKRAGSIKDTWVSFCKILVKDNHDHIKTVNSAKDLR